MEQSRLYTEKGGTVMTLDELREKDRAYIQQTYSRYPVAIDHGKGATLWDTEGKAYIDFTSGLGVNALGYGNEQWTAAVAAQAGKLAHASNLFYTAPCVELAETLCIRSGMAAAFFGNSGAEANEGAIKTARKYSFDKYGKGRGTILTLWNSFHGHTVTTLSAAGQEAAHPYFYPFDDGFRHAEASILGVEAVAGHDVCAVMLALIRSEDGAWVADRGFVHDLAVLCAERDWLLLIDEVQTGIGRTGSLFCYQQYGIKPDVVTFAKGVAGGLPMGGFLVNEKCREVLTEGTHGSTFGGNPVCAAAAGVVLEALNDDALESVKEKGLYLRGGIESLELPCFGTTRGMGLMLGVEVKEGYRGRELAERLLANGLLVLTAGPAVLLLPPLTVTKEEMDRGLTIMKETLD